MSTSEQDIKNWLSASPTENTVNNNDSETDIKEWLGSDKKKQNSELSIDTKKAESSPVSDFGAGATDAFLNLLDIPNSAYNWAAEQLGSDSRFPSTRDLGAALNIGYAKDDEPDTGSYRAGEYTMLGLEFLAPILKAGRVMEGAIVATNPSIAKGMSQQIAKPFASSPATALSVELTSGAVSGYGSYYGGEEYGAVGEQVGGLAGVAPALVAGSASRSVDYIVKSVFPFTNKGGRAKAGAVIRQLRESPNFIDEIKRQETLSLKSTKHTPARLSKEPYLIALEKAITHDDPQLTHTLRKIDSENNALAKTAMKELAGDGQIESAIKSLGDRYTKLKVRLDLKVDSALAVAKQSVNKISPLSQRKLANIEVSQQINSALKAARVSENALWDTVEKTAIATTKESKEAFLKILIGRETEADPKDIPSYLYKFLGKLDKKTGQLKGGKYEDTRHVGGLQQLRSRLLQTIRSEKSGDTPNWNKVRMLEDVEESILKDMGNSPASSSLNDAIKFSRELNSKFKGDIMSVVLRNSRTGGSLAPELTLESLGTGAKGAFHIKRILSASPESKSNIEDILKMNIVQQKIVKKGVLNIQKAKDYMSLNEQVMDIFPVLKDDMNNAIFLAEVHDYFSVSAKLRMKKAEGALGFSLADKTNPGSFLTKIMASKNPSLTMKRVIRQVNSKGKEGIKSDIIEMVLKKSKITDIGIDETFKLSGKKGLGYWNENKDVLSEALDNKEIKRLERILNDLRLGDTPKDIPVDVAKTALEPEKTILGYVIETVAARFGAQLGKGTSGASLKTASKASNVAKDLVDKLDMGTAKALLKSAVQDKDLYIELAEDMSTLEAGNKSFNALSGWFMAHTLSSLEEKQDIED